MTTTTETTTSTTIQPPVLRFFWPNKPFRDAALAGFRGATDHDGTAYAGDPDITEAINVYNGLAAQYRHHDAEANRLFLAAPEAEQQWHRDTRAALAEGRSIADLDNPRPRMEAEAQEHADKRQAVKRAIEAQSQRVQWMTTGEPARDACAPLDARLPDTRKALRDLLDKLDPLAQEWDRDFGTRVTLARRDLFGTNRDGYKGSATSVGALLGAARAALEEYDLLVQEEEAVRQWRNR